jgi:hypothetical protein
MKKLYFLALLIPTMLSASCVLPSLQPLFTKQTVVFKEDLLGTWQDTQGTLCTLTEDFGYYGQCYCMPSPDKESSSYRCYLVQVGEHYFLDCFPKDSQCRFAAGVVTHVFYLLDLSPGTVKVRLMSPDWFKEYATKHPHACEFEMVSLDGDDTHYVYPLLTASTEELQHFMVENIDTPGAYYDGAIYTRIEPTAPLSVAAESS